MQNFVLNIAEKLEGRELIDSRLSFRRFIDFLKDRKMHEKTMKLKYLEFVISHFESRLKGKETITVEEAGGYEDLLELIYSALFPAIEDERDNLWALSLPLHPVIFYGTGPFYDLLRDPATGEPRASLIDKDNRSRKGINLEFAYTFIIRRLYNFTAYFPATTIIHSFVDEATGASNFYRLNIDTRFIDVIPKEPLPHLDWDELQEHMHAGTAIPYLAEHLPLTLFRFEGFAAITVTDITMEYVVESIKNTILKPDHNDGHTHYDMAIRSLRALAGNDAVDFGLLPFLRVNGKPVFSEEICCHSVLAEAAIQHGEAEETYLSMTEKYYRDPTLIFYENLDESLDNKAFFLKTLRDYGVKAYALLPVWYNAQLAGVLEVSSRKAGTLDHALLYRLDIVLPLLAQLLQKNIDEFEAELKAVIKENFTSIQPAVEWKFNEAAWHYMREQQWSEQRPGIDTIYFENVYPLYGAIDIRNSTVERNNALRKDLETQFEVLIFTLTNLQKHSGLALLEELIFQCRKWQEAISGMLTTAEEMELNTFMKEKVDAFFSHFSDSRPDTASIIAPYLKAIDEDGGIAFKARRDLELSIQTINKTINRQLEKAMEELQKTYPSYFEKFRTDGVEYDIYIGQSIAPDKVFDVIYLRNLRLWQLTSMASIAMATHILLPQMPGKLVTTQLIFVHSNPIDISFRKDERRFDVEGGYNIRYQVVKKRVDKVHLRGSDERLTQPGKIAVIYFNEKEAEEYLGYVKYLQQKGVLEDDLEHLELEELQGVSGLRAFRVGVKLGAPLPSPSGTTSARGAMEKSIHS
ncbi:MAG TPA: GAF domain-containing protein [Puia sp.]